ncbi:MAG: aspartate/glutamate racemase family protein [Ramlibacter sp.]
MRTASIRAIHAPAAPVFPAVGACPQRGGPREAGSFLGILMLQTRFPRPPGDIGHPASFAVPTRRVVVEGATPQRVVRDAAELRASGLVARFAAAARRLEAEGAAAITTSCGFLVLFQRELQEAVRVPLVASSLLMLPPLLAAGRHAGVLTVSAQRLGPAYLEAAGVPADRVAAIPVAGIAPDSVFATTVLGDRPDWDAGQAAADVVAAAVRLRQRAPGLDTLVLECTNLPPYASRIEQATGLQTVSLLQCETLLAPFGAGG